jgi:hypothetical protein
MNMDTSVEEAETAIGEVETVADMEEAVDEATARTM